MAETKTKRAASSDPVPEHLANAARVLEGILAREYPDHVFTVEVRPGKEGR
jgi:hypothetical protein